MVSVTVGPLANNAAQKCLTAGCSLGYRVKGTDALGRSAHPIAASPLEAVAGLQMPDCHGSRRQRGLSTGRLPTSSMASASLAS
jgi:hypothetical protein